MKTDSSSLRISRVNWSSDNYTLLKCKYLIWIAISSGLYSEIMNYIERKVNYVISGHKKEEFSNRFLLLALVN